MNGCAKCLHDGFALFFHGSYKTSGVCKVFGALFTSETARYFLIADKDFTNRNRINSMLSKDLTGVWEIESVGEAGFKIKSTGAKKYLTIAKIAGSLTEKITLITA